LNASFLRQELTLTRLHARSIALLSLGLLLFAPSAVRAQDDDPAAFRPAEPDFTLIGLPTSLRLPKFGSAFRVTHRFLRPLGQGDFGDLVGDGFGIDNGGQIGLEFRFGIIPNGQIGIHRTTNKTIEFFGEYSVWRQGKSMPIDVSALATVEGTDNFKDHSPADPRHVSPSVGAILSRTVGAYAAFYVEPIYVNNTNPLPKELVDHNDTFIVGVGARIRVRPTVYLTGELAPRAAGYKPGVTHGGFAIEKHVGGHMFQLNFSDNIGTTMAQIARGGSLPASGSGHDWFMGFNISRKFF
jgi:hypothetical protein